METKISRFGLLAVSAALLAALPAAGTGPAVETLTDSGHIACAVTVQTATVETGHGQLPNVPPCGDSDTQLEVAPQPLRKVTGAIVVLEWTPTNSFAQRLDLGIPTFGVDAQFHFCTEDSFNPVTHKLEGESPLRVAFELEPQEPGDHLWQVNPGGELPFNVRPDAPEANHSTPPNAGIILGQDVELAVTLFYDNTPVDEC